MNIEILLHNFYLAEDYIKLKGKKLEENYKKHSYQAKYLLENSFIAEINRSFNEDMPSYSQINIFKNNRFLLSIEYTAIGVPIRILISPEHASMIEEILKRNSSIFTKKEINGKLEYIVSNYAFIK